MGQVADVFAAGPVKTVRQAAGVEALADTWPARLLQSAIGAAALPGDVYAGRVNPNSDEAVNKATDLAGLLTMGARGVPGGGLRSGAAQPPIRGASGGVARASAAEQRQATIQMREMDVDFGFDPHSKFGVYDVRPSKWLEPRAAERNKAAYFTDDLQDALRAGQEIGARYRNPAQ